MEILRNISRRKLRSFLTISGIVIERKGTIGATVGSDANLFKIINISSVWKSNAWV